MGNNQSSPVAEKQEKIKTDGESKSKSTDHPLGLIRNPFSKCPMSRDNDQHIYDEKKEFINPRNQMPEISQEKALGQKTVLSTERSTSIIPKCASEDSSDTDMNWMYPSYQQFNNALKRKGKDAPEELIPTMVELHNFMNDNTWKEIIKWEKTFHCDCKNVTLDQFSGKSDKISPLALINYYLFNSEKPFDRHDWIIDRCGKKVRYIIDYYSGNSSIENDSVEMAVVARPALDSLTSFYDRIRMATYNNWGRLKNWYSNNLDIKSPK